MLNSIAFTVLLLLPRLSIRVVYDIEDIMAAGFQVCNNEIGCIQKITGRTDVLFTTLLSKKVSCIKSGLLDRTLRTVRHSSVGMMIGLRAERNGVRFPAGTTDISLRRPNQSPIRCITGVVSSEGEVGKQPETEAVTVHVDTARK